MTKCVLGDVADVIISGVDKKTKDGEEKVRLCNYTDVYYNWAITGDKHDGLMEASAKPEEIRKFKIRKGQVALTKDSETRNDIGIPTYIADDFEDVILGYHCALITPHDKQLDGKYLNALLRTKYAKEFFANNAGGSGQRYYLSDTSIKELPLFLPDFAEQKRIGKFLSAIDCKIALNRKRIATLEAMAKEIYDYWFVQFDFPDAHGRPYKSSGGAMVYNPDLKREIPKGWEVGDFTDLIDFTMGQSPAGSTLNEAGDGVLFYQGATDFGLYFPSPRQFTNNPVRMARAGDVLLSVRAPVGTLNFASDDCCVGRGLGAFRGKETSNLFVWFYLRSLKPYFDSKNVAGTTFGSIGKDDFKMLKTIIPAKSTLCAYNEVSENIYKQMLLCNCEMAYDGKLRDFLLPLLMNGQVRIGSWA